MKTGRDKDDKPPAMPFQVDHKLDVDIPTQVTDGIRTAILTGFYKPGDILPKAMEFTRGLHVSLRAPLAAYRTLKKEGLISPRRRLGTVVVGPKADVFHGRVVIVNQGNNPDYFESVLNEVLTRRLNAAGYAVSSASAMQLQRKVFPIPVLPISSRFCISSPKWLTKCFASRTFRRMFSREVFPFSSSSGFASSNQR